MRNTSSTYQTLRTQTGAFYEVEVIRGSTTYDIHDLYSLKITPKLFDGSGPSIGNAYSAICEVVLKEESRNWPRMAQFSVRVRLSSADGLTTSEWLPMGTYWTDERSEDKATGKLTITAYDSMLQMEQTWADKIPEQYLPANWPITSKAWMDMIVAAGIAQVDSRSIIDDTVAFIGLNTEIGDGDEEEDENDIVTFRDVLKSIAAANGGNWVVTYDNKLRLVPLANVTREGSAIAGIAVAGIAVVGLTEDRWVAPGGIGSDNLALRIQSFDSSPALDAVSGVHVTMEVGISVDAGTDSGYVLNANCNFSVTEGVANLCLSKVQGYIYRPFTAGKAVLNPAAEIGDTAVIDNVPYQMAEIGWNLHTWPTATIGAAYEEEVNHEYEYKDNVEKIYQKIVKDSSSMYTAIQQNALGVSLLAQKTEKIESDLVDVVETSNHIPFPYNYTGTVSMGFGVTATFNADGSITLNGNVGGSGITTFGIAYNIPLAPGTYRLYLKQPSTYTAMGVSLIFTSGSDYRTDNLNASTEDGLIVNTSSFTYPEYWAGYTYYNSLKIEYNLEKNYDNYTIYPMISKGDTVKKWSKLSRNMLFYPYEAFRQRDAEQFVLHGITFKNNGDGTITLDGTADSSGYIELVPKSSHFKLWNNIQSGSQSYVMSLLGEAVEHLHLDLNDNPSGNIGYQYATTQTNIVLSISDSCRYYDFYLHLSYQSGDVFDNVTVYPMIQFGTTKTDYEIPPDAALIKDRISEMSASLVVMADSIESKVSKDGVISSINQSAEAITINASKLNLTGYITATDVGATGTTIINGSRIHGGTLILGGNNNENGVLQIKDAYNNVIGTWDRNGIYISGGTISGPSISGGTIEGTEIKGSSFNTYRDTTLVGTINSSWVGPHDTGYCEMEIKVPAGRIFLSAGEHVWINSPQIELTTNTSYSSYYISITSSGIRFYRGSTLMDAWS